MKKKKTLEVINKAKIWSLGETSKIITSLVRLVKEKNSNIENGKMI